MIMEKIKLLCVLMLILMISILVWQRKPEVFTMGLQDSFSKRPLLSTNWKMSENKQVFILGASCVNTSTVLDKVHIYGQWYYTNDGIDNYFLICCFKFDDKATIQTNANVYVKRTRRPVKDEKLKMWHVTCQNPRKGKLPDYASIATKHVGFDCKSANVSYVRPYFPLTQKHGSLVIGTKAAHTNLNAEMVVSWMETYKYLGVDKVVTYRLKNLNTDAAKVLDYYASIGILDLFDHDLSDDINMLRNISYDNQTWSDQRVIMIDYFERYSGYTFAGIIDHDEFLIPGANQTLNEMLLYLFRKFSNASSFRFKSEFFITSGEKQNNESFLKRYITRDSQGPIWDRWKLISRTAAKFTVPVSAHDIHSRKGTQTYDCPVDVGYIRHYRKCVLGRPDRCKSGISHVKDLSMDIWSRRIEKNVKHVLQTVLNQF